MGLVALSPLLSSPEEGDGNEWRWNREFGSGDLREKSAG